MTSRWARAVATTAVAAVLIAGCSSDGGESASDRPSTTTATAATPSTVAAPTGPFTGGDFYAPPDPLPAGTHGALLRYQPNGSTATYDGYRIMYLSQAVD